MRTVGVKGLTVSVLHVFVVFLNHPIYYLHGVGKRSESGECRPPPGSCRTQVGRQRHHHGDHQGNRLSQSAGLCGTVAVTMLLYIRVSK